MRQAGRQDSSPTQKHFEDSSPTQLGHSSLRDSVTRSVSSGKIYLSACQQWRVIFCLILTTDIKHNSGPRIKGHLSKKIAIIINNKKIIIICQL